MNDDDAPIPVFTIVPAQPDWYVAIFIPAGTDGDETWEPHFIFEPIIAWKIGHRRYHRNVVGKKTHDRLHEIEPLGLEGDYESTTDVWIYRRPDGRFDGPFEGQYENEAAALKHLQGQHEINLAALAKASS